MNAVIMSFDPNEKQSVICERKQEQNDRYLFLNFFLCCLLFQDSTTKKWDEVTFG